MTKAGIYARVSSEQQRDNTSIDTQLADCRAYAVKRGWQVYHEYIDEAESGRNAKRPALQQLLRDVQLRRLDAVLVWKLDRLARNTADALTMIDNNFSRITFESVTENIDRMTAGGRFSLTVMAGAAQLYSDMLSERVSRALKHKAEAGQWVGPAPFGYTNNGQRLVPNEDAPAVRTIFALYATGNHSYTSIADHLNSDQIRYRNRQGQLGLFGRETVRGILNNAAYIGNSGSIEATHQPLISRELWQQASAVRQRHTHQGGKPRQYQQSMLLGVAFCGECNQRMWQHTSQRLAHHKRHHYLRCSGFSNRSCLTGLQPLAVLEVQTVAMLKLMALPDELHDQVLRLVSEPTPIPKVDPAGIRQTLARYAEVYAEGVISKDQYQQRKAALEAQLQAQPAAVAPIDLQHAAALLADLPALIDAATPDERRQLVGLLFDRIWIQKRTIVAISPREAYASLLDAVTIVRVGGVAEGRYPHAQHSLPPLWTDFRLIRRNRYAA